MSGQPRPSPLHLSSLLSRISFAWANGLITKGEKKVLREDDVSDVSEEDQCSSIDSVVETSWSKEKRHSRSPSLVWALARSFSWMFLFAQCCRLIQFACTVNAPLILRQLITYIDAGPTGQGRGLGLIVAFFLNQIGFSIFIEHSFDGSSRLGRSVRTSMYSAIFKKSLSMSNKARQKYSLGELTTLMSVNASQVGSYVDQLSTIILSPLLAVVIFYRLFNLLGVAAVFALAVMLVLIPTNLLMTDRAEIIDKERMKKTEQRMKLLTEVLNGIKVVKLNAWERCFGQRVMSAREDELGVLRRFYTVSALFSFSWTVVPYLMSVITFAAYVYLTGDMLDAQTAFLVVSYLNILKYSLNETSLVFLFFLKINLHLGRIRTFLLEDDHKTDGDSPDKPCVADAAVDIQNGTFVWDDERLFVLKCLNLKIPRGSLTAVVGAVGAGKSSLLSAILREMEKLTGHVHVKGRTAYLPQQAWIQNVTLQENILFGQRLEKLRYEDILEACALNPDLAQFPGGDQVEIGEKGINLSGGQKQRVSLARAVYSDADVVLLDDPLSAVDNHVARHIFSSVISNNGILKNKTRVLVTHNMAVLPHVDHILVVSGGSVTESGSYSQLLDNDGPFSAMLKHSQSDYNTSNKDLLSLENSPGATGPTRPHSSTKVQPSDSKIITEEETRVGGVSLDVYRLFLSALGGVRCLLLLLLYGVYYAVFMYAHIWLTQWVEDPALRGSTVPPTTTRGGAAYDDTYNHTTTSDSLKWRRTQYYLAGYAGLGVLQAVLLVTYTYCQGRALISAGRTLHHQLLQNVLRSPMSFYDTTPIGRIMSRFSGDLGAVDINMTNTLDGWLNGIGNVVGGLLMICYVAPSALATIIPMFFVFLSVQRGYISTTRQLTRLASVSQAPVISFFNEAVSGTSVIRALAARAGFWKTFARKVDSNCKFSFFSALCNRWLSVRLNFIGNIILTTAITTLCLGRDVVTGGSVGLIVSFAVEFGSKLVWFIVNTTRLEVYSVSLERIFQYTTSPTEATWTRRGLPPPLDWPRHGDIEFRKLSLRYREGLDLVLKDVSFKVKHCEKIGIVGRTGAGKSSLMLSLFRLFKPTDGAIFVDGIDISTLELDELRSKIAVIPQDPVLFTGSLRMNLDPERESSDAEIWTALEHTRLKQVVEALPHQLMAECGEGGQNYSVGQRQLLCLARTLLKKTKILVLDEATAAVDMATDNVIQDTIRREFPHCTVLTIAHRLNTVMDYDRILVMDSGRVSEFDTPSTLLKNTTGTFSCLARSAGIVS